MPTQSFSKHTLKYSEFLQAIHIWALRIPGHAAVQKQNCNLNSSVLQEIPSQAILFSLQYPLSYLLKLFCYSFLFSSQEIFYSVVLSLLFYCHCSFKNAATEKKKKSFFIEVFSQCFFNLIRSVLWKGSEKLLHNWQGWALQFMALF